MLDGEIERILALSDEDLIAEALAAGLDPHEEAEKCRAAFRRALARASETAP